MHYVILLGLFLPLIGFLTLTATYRVLSRRLTGWIACSTIFLSFLCFSYLLFLYMTKTSNPMDVTVFPWIPIPGLQADFTLHVDALSLLMSLIITGVGFLIHVYSNGYMDHDEDYVRFFAFLNFFVFSMLLLVLAGNLLVLFVGWEGVGLASYLLIGFWYTRLAAARAATKAFVVNRIGDLGFLLGLILTFYLFGTSNIAEINQRAGQSFAVGAPIITILTLLYFIGATGKSAQLPLQTWLPDAMEGPTPVSALIHAATMVTAGVYLVVRMHPLFLLAPTTMQVIGIIGAVTSLYAALSALGQIDLKRVLAFSTISQLGLMFLACGVGAFYAAMFHLTTHAFIKALLFLSAGNVVHMMHGNTDMEQMGGLSRIFKKTHWLFLIGVLAMSGIPPLAAFFSKDLLLEEASSAGFKTLFYIGLVTSILTAFYLTRAYCLAFTGQPRSQNQDVKEAPSIMLLPETLLALLSIFGGFLGYAFGKMPVLERLLSKVGIATEGPMSLMTPETLLSVIGALLGIGAAAILYTRYVDRLGQPIPLLRKAFFVNELYWRLIVLPLKALAKFITDVFEPKVLNGSIDMATQATQGVASWLQQVQSGQLRSYVAWMAIGTVLLIAYFAF